MKVIALITDYAAVDGIIDHLKLKFIAEEPPPILSSRKSPNRSSKKLKDSLPASIPKHLLRLCRNINWNMD